MIEEYINSLTKDSEFEEDMFLKMVDGSRPSIDRQKEIETFRRACKKYGRVLEFNNMLKAYMQSYVQELKQDNSNMTDFFEQPIALKCGKYVANNQGVKLTELNKNFEAYTITACPHPLTIVERYVNIDTDTEKARIAFYKDGRWRELTVDNGVIFNKSNITTLADRGIIVTSENAKEMVKYLAELINLNADEITLYNSTSRLGWIGDDFAPYAEGVKYDGDLDFQSMYDCVKEEGDLFKWVEHMNELRKHKEIRLMMAASFASPLIELVGALPFVLHLWGKTGFGKTVSLMVASSIWGNPDYGKLTRSMNMTANAMSRTASFLYSIPFCADELQQIKDNWGGNYDNLIMKLCEGIDRGRAKARGGVEQLMTWRNAFIFTGEEPVTKANSGGGVKNRCIEIEVKDQIITDGNKTATIVKENYGRAGMLYINYLQQRVSKSDMAAEYKKIFQKIMTECDTTEKQAYSMALILLADMYSCECIFNKDEPLKVSDIKDFLHSAKSVDPTERAFAWLVDWVQENIAMFDNDKKIASGKVYGKLTDNGTVLINKTTLTSAMHSQGFDFDACKKDWAKKGYLIMSTDNRYASKNSMNGVKSWFVEIDTGACDKDGFAEIGQGELPFD